MRWFMPLAIVLFLAMGAFPGESEDEKFVSLADRYLEGYLRLYPERATALGDHRYDDRLEDRSKEGYREKLLFNRRCLEALQAIATDRLSLVNRIDYTILKSRIEFEVFSLEELREHTWNPLVYNVGQAFYLLMARDFAPLPQRLRSLARRLRDLPKVLEAARTNLENPPRVHTETAIRQNEGNLKLLGIGLDRILARAPELKREIAPCREKALAELVRYGRWLRRDLLDRSHGEFRLGEDKFARKLRYTLEADLPMGEILARAREELEKTKEEMYRTALPLFQRFFPERSVKGLEREQVVRAVLDRLADEHADNETVVAEARRCLRECTEFVRSRGLVTVPEEPIRLIVMPEFQRGVAVAYCDAPGPLESKGETFYAIAPTPRDWTPRRVESFFREYNRYMLYDLTIHEAMPGHYLQLTHARRFHAATKVRAVFASGPFVEGWATYAEQLMVENGFGGAELRMQQLKMRLRLIINAIIDQGIHAGLMDERKAMDLMMKEGFQEEGEAAGKWKRACLTSAQLSTYFVGNLAVNDLRRAYRAKMGSAYDARSFHDRLLSFGSPPLKFLPDLMGL